MYRLMVVDDEDYITDSLSYMLEDLEDPVLEVCKAYSAMEAIGLLNNRVFDIVLTDIQMPGMSGIELLKEIHEKWPSCKVVFLTGYDSFEYAYQALKYGAFRFILKTEGDEVIVRTVRECISSIEKDALHTVIQKDINLSNQEDFLRSLIAGVVPEKEILGTKLSDYHMTLQADKPVMLLFGKTSSQMKQDLLVGIQQILISKVGHAIRCECMCIDRHMALWLVQSAETDNDEHAKAAIMGFAEQIQDVCEKILNTKLSFVFDPTEVSWRELPRHFAHVRNLVNKYWTDDLDIAMVTTMYFTPDSLLFFSSDDSVARDDQQNSAFFVNRIMLYISSNLNSDLSLTSLSEHMYMNPSYISRRFKELTGNNIKDVILKLRMDKAKEMLIDTNEKIGRIAFDVGFESSAHFSRVFRHCEGTSPQDYRNSNPNIGS